MLTTGIFGSLKSNSCHRLFVHCSFLDSKSKVCFWVRQIPSSDLLTCKIFYRIMSRKYARCAKPPPASWQDSADIAAHFVSNAPSSKFTTCLAATLTFQPLLYKSDLSAMKLRMTTLIEYALLWIKAIFIFIDWSGRVAATAEANHASQCSLTALEASGSGSPLQVCYF